MQQHLSMQSNDSRLFEGGISTFALWGLLILAACLLFRDAIDLAQRCGNPVDTPIETEVQNRHPSAIRRRTNRRPIGGTERRKQNGEPTRNSMATTAPDCGEDTSIDVFSPSSKAKAPKQEAAAMKKLTMRSRLSERPMSKQQRRIRLMMRPRLSERPTKRQQR